MSLSIRFPQRLGALFLAVAASLISTQALAQWQWVDSSGRKVFSDTPPPAGTPDKSILKRPGAAISLPSAESSTETAAAPASTAAPAAPKLNTADRELEAKKKQAEEAEQAKNKAEADRIAKARADNCERANRAKATMDSGIRIATTNAKGEREIMDDKARAAENKRLDEAVRSNCGPAAAL
jgi:hypothetical protein